MADLESKNPCTHPFLNPAVQRCCNARNLVLFGTLLPPEAHAAHNQNFAWKGLSEGYDAKQVSYRTAEEAGYAYRAAMPDPSTRQGIKDFIACVLHGMAVGAVSHNEGYGLLSGARVALAGHRGKPIRSAEKANTQKYTENRPQHAF